MTRPQDRQFILSIFDEAVQAGARRCRCAMVLGLSLRTLKRWQTNQQDQRPYAHHPTPDNALSEQERKEILRVCNLPENASKPPAQIVVALADQGIYLASESSLYRILRDNKMQHHRGRAQAPKSKSKPTTHVAKAPNQVWCWDVTWLPSNISGKFYKMYVILDLYSRKIIASEVWNEENSQNSISLIQRAHLAENLAANNTPCVLHGDNGSPLKAATVLAFMYSLGINPSHSRPRVSNDNAFAESFFRTAKYHPSLPQKGFQTLQEARQWNESFVHWYNHQHLHSALRSVTPQQKHTGQDFAILKARQKVYQNAKAANPNRWIQNKVRNCEPVTQTTLNPTNQRKLEKIIKKTA